MYRTLSEVGIDDFQGGWKYRCARRVCASNLSPLLFSTVCIIFALSSSHSSPLVTPCHMIMAINLECEKVHQTADSETFTHRVQSDSPHPEALKMTHDGRTVLTPQPSSDPNDPLNWSQWKKTVVLLVVSATAFLADFGSSMGAVTSVVQSNML